ncbi:MAG: hypothetical protein CMQ16_11025 [Gammaproteobacteria bacterium]|nr:hypothetical protein [Gammaproteobacteria bacterium]
MPSMIHSRLINSLGYAGLLPFLAAVWAAYADLSFGAWSTPHLFLSYSVIILSFLAGALWGKAKELEESNVNRFLLISSNVFALTAWLAVLLGRDYLLAGLAVSMTGFILVYLVEHKTRGLLLQGMDSTYLKFRLTLTSVVCIAHLVIIALTQ